MFLFTVTCNFLKISQIKDKFLTNFMIKTPNKRKITFRVSILFSFFFVLLQTIRDNVFQKVYKKHFNIIRELKSDKNVHTTITVQKIDDVSFEHQI